MAALAEESSCRRRPPPATAPLLEIDDLRTWFFTRDGVVRAVDGVSLSACCPARRLAIVGESGCGKSVTALSVLRLIRDAAGTHRLGVDPASTARPPGAGPATRRCGGFAATKISMIFQEPMTSPGDDDRPAPRVAENTLIHQGLEPARRAHQRRRWRGCAWVTFRRRNAASRTLRTSCRAGCGSG